MKLVIATLWVLLSWAGITLAQQKHIYIANDDHTDYFWTADDVTYRAAFLEQLDYYLDLADATSNFPSAYQSRWNCDGSLWLWEYERNKPVADFNRLIARLKSGHISAPLTALVSCYGGTPAEAVLRGMYYPGRLECRYGLRFPMAVAMENQTLPLGLAALWAGAGARWSWRGVCSCASQVPAAGDREHDIYWFAGLDGQRVLMKWYDLAANDQLGGYAEARNPSLAVDQCDAKCLTTSYPYAVAGAFGKGWDDLKTLTNEFVTVAQTKTTANRQVIVSNEEDFFRDFETNYGTNLPSVAVTFGNEWELYAASLAEVSAKVKRSVEQLRAAEAVATLVGLQDPAFLTNNVGARDLAWMDLGLYWEHDWTGDGPVARTTRAAWSRKIAGEIESYVTNLHARATTALGGLIQKTGTNPRFYAFNPLSWPRTDYADLPWAGGVCHVMDLSTGSETPSQIVTNDDVRALRILAGNVPSVGYKTFEIQDGPGAHFDDAGAVTGNVISNSVYLLRLHPRGAITNLVDKTRGNREFANGALNDLGSGAGSSSFQTESSGPVSVTLVATSSVRLAHTSRVTLFRDSSRIEIRNDILQNFSATNTWRFGFNLTAPDVWHEEVGAVIRAKKQAQGGHYSDRTQNCRYDWQTLNHFADITGSEGVGVTLANADCLFMKLGNSTVGTLDTTTPQISVLVGGQVDGTGLGIQNQDGDTRFRQRFALQTHDAYGPVAAMQVALEFQNPLVTGLITGGSAYPGTNFSAVSISNSNVLLWALKPAEEGIRQGVIARVWNLATNQQSYALNWFQPVRRLQRTTHIETDLSDAVLPATINAQQLQTYRLNGPPPLAVLDFGLAGDVFLRWTDLGTDYRYTVEARDSLAAGEWQAILPTNQWPIVGTNWSGTTGGASQRFYRVRGTGNF